MLILLLYIWQKNYTINNWLTKFRPCFYFPISLLYNDAYYKILANLISIAHIHPLSIQIKEIGLARSAKGLAHTHTHTPTRKYIYTPLQRQFFLKSAQPECGSTERRRTSTRVEFPPPRRCKYFFLVCVVYLYFGPTINVPYFRAPMRSGSNWNIRGKCTSHKERKMHAEGNSICSRVKITLKAFSYFVFFFFWLMYERPTYSSELSLESFPLTRERRVFAMAALWSTPYHRPLIAFNLFFFGRFGFYKQEIRSRWYVYVCYLISWVSKSN